MAPPLYQTIHASSPLLKPSLIPFPFPLQKPALPFYTPKPRTNLIVTAAASSASTSQIDMVRNKQGIYTPKQNKVVVLWDLDNKPPRGPPYPAAMSLKRLAQSVGDVIELSAYANRHAFIHLPQWVAEERRGRKELDFLERKGLVSPPPGSYTCGVCGRKCRSHLDLKKHFKQLHERERQKKVNRMRSLKGKKRQRFKERFISGNHKYNEEERRLLTPRVGYGLAAELRRAGVYVKTVEDKPQAADWALKRQIEHSMSRGVDWLFLVSDDSDFRDIIRRAREAQLGTVVVGDRDRALGRHADVWVPWEGVESGEVTEKDLVTKRSWGEGEGEGEGYEEGSFTVTDFGGGGEMSGLESVFDEFVAVRGGYGGMRISVFSEGEDEDEEDGDEDDEHFVWSDEGEDFELDDEAFFI